MIHIERTVRKDNSIKYNSIKSTGKKGNNKFTEQFYKGKVKTHKYINRQNQSTSGKLGKS